MNTIPVSSLLPCPARLAQITARRRSEIDLLDEPDLRLLVRILAVKSPLVFDAAWRELRNGAAA